MMLHNRRHNLIARLQVSQAIGIGNEIQALRRITREDNLLLAFGVDEPLHSNASILISIGSLHRQLIQAAQRISVMLQIKIAFCINNALRLLRRRRIVQISNVLCCKQRKILFIINGEQILIIHHHALLLPDNAAQAAQCPHPQYGGKERRFLPSPSYRQPPAP